MYFTFLFLLSFVSFQRIGVIKAHWNNFRISIEVYLLSGVHSVLLGFTVVFFLAVLMFYSNLSEDSAIQNHCCLICTRTGDEHYFFLCFISSGIREGGTKHRHHDILLFYIFCIDGVILFLSHNGFAQSSKVWTSCRLLL